VRVAQQAQAAAEANATLEGLNELMELHREAFVNATPPRADSAALPDREQFLAEEMKKARDGVSWFDFSARRAARTRAREAAAQRFADAVAASREDREARQAGLDDVWAKLNANDPETVLMVLEAAFEDNDAAATPVGVEGAELSVAVLVPGTDVIPDRMPYVTDSGRLSTKKMTKTMANSFYASVLAGYMIVTAKEAFAVAPGITRARVVALRRTAPDAYGKERFEAIAAAGFQREAFDGIRWDNASGAEVLDATADEIVYNPQGRTGEAAPIDVSSEPEVAELLNRIDTDGLT
jgi:hypothetical protein